MRIGCDGLGFFYDESPRTESVSILRRAWREYRGTRPGLDIATFDRAHAEDLEARAERL